MHMNRVSYTGDCTVIFTFRVSGKIAVTISSPGDEKSDAPIEEKGTPDDTLEFELKIKCRKNPNAPKDASDPDDLYIDHKGKSGLFFFKSPLLTTTMELFSFQMLIVVVKYRGERKNCV